MFAINNSKNKQEIYNQKLKILGNVFVIDQIYMSISYLIGLLSFSVIMHYISFIFHSNP